MLNKPRSRKLLLRLVTIAIAAVVVSFVAYQMYQVALYARLSATEKKIAGAWSWTYLEGVGRMVFTADHRVKEGFPLDDRNRPAMLASDFTYLLSGTWRVEGDVLVTEIDNHLFLGRFSRRPLLHKVLFLPPSSYKPEFEKKTKRDKIVRLDEEKMMFEDGHWLDRVKR